MLGEIHTQRLYSSKDGLHHTTRCNEVFAELGIVTELFNVASPEGFRQKAVWLLWSLTTAR